MTREQAKELLPIIQAFAEGKEIEIKTKEGSEWDKLEEDDMQYIDFQKCDLRIKPAYRPFKNAKECWNEMLKHQPFGYVQEEGRATYAAIFYITEFNIETFDNYYNYKDASKLFFADGTPFGIKEE